MDSAQYTDLFVSEAQDHLLEMSQALLAIEEARRAGASVAETEQVAALFRAAHTLKGMAASLGFQQIALLAHHMEDALDLLRQKQRSLTTPLADALFACLDRLGDLVGAVAASGSESGDASRELALLENVLQAAPESAPAEPEPSPQAPSSQAAWEVRVQIAPDCQLKGPRAFVVMRRLSNLAALLECQPTEPELHAGNYDDGFSLFFGADADPQALGQAAERVAEVVSADLISLQPAESESTSLSRAETAVGDSGASPLPAPVSALPHAPLARAPASHPANPEALPGEPGAVPTMVRLKVGLLDQLLEAAADMVVNHSLLMQVARKHDLPDLSEALEAHAAAVKRLEQVVLSMRMVPVAQVFNRFPRLVRDLALSLGKEVHFEMEGSEIELDRMILDRLADPLVHLLRNAIDHGVELPAERAQAGKPLPAQIRLAARRLQNKVLIEVSDDGRGLSPETILKVALERGVITSRQAASLDQHAILDLICLPGFSTKAQVSGVSGRGVGMDVVKRTLNEMGGALEIEAHPGQGSLFRLICPLTMAILPAILVRSAAEYYAIPLTHVVHTLEPQVADLRWLYAQPVLPWKDTLLPLISLGQILGTPGATPIPRLPDQPSLDQAVLPPEPISPEKPSLPGAQTPTGMSEAGSQSIQVVVVAPSRQAYGLVVDEILGKEDIVLKPLAKYLGSIAGLSGVSLRGEGEIALVLDVTGLVQTSGWRKENNDE